MKSFDAQNFRTTTFSALVIGLTCSAWLLADPCGMVPPIYTGPGTPITRTGLQQTYVFFDDGVESFVIRPGFSGKVDNFGMLIPFPTAPALRKVSDNVFEQIDNAIDPPEVVVDLRPKFEEFAPAPAGMGGGGGGGGLVLREKVTVLKQEAVGMYEVAVLEAGSAASLKRWMDQNQYVYPKGMDAVTEDYINEGWCFVAVKTKVGAKADADPRPGQRNAKPQMPAGSTFDGNVQGLGFRFKTDNLVVPMRLSAFNDGDLRNVVYLLTRGGKRINLIPEEYVVRQLPGKQLVDNLTQPLPLRIIGGTAKDIPDYLRVSLVTRRDPAPKNRVAKHLFTSDILARNLPDLSLPHEEDEKELLRIGEHFGLRGADIDAEIAATNLQKIDEKSESALATLADMTLTVVDGDFPREVIANQNLTFSNYKIAAARNNERAYDTKLHAPGQTKEGIRISAANLDDAEQQLGSNRRQRLNRATTLGVACLLLMGIQIVRRRQSQN